MTVKVTWPPHYHNLLKEPEFNIQENALCLLPRMKKLLIVLSFALGIMLLTIPDFLLFYLIMPVPTSQQSDQLELAHTLYEWIWPLRIAGALLLLPFFIRSWSKGRFSRKLLLTSVVGIIIFMLYLLNFRFSAEQRFKEPQILEFATPATNKVDKNTYVLGVAINGEAKAYPLKFVGYHHKIQDMVGGQSVLITYCTMCRTGMVYDPVVNGIHQQFRLVGAAFNNAIIEDASTKSWWYQSTGIAGAGSMKGNSLEIIPYQQVTLESWIQQYPGTLVMQPDPKFTNQYAKLKSYDINVPAVNTDPERKKLFLPNSWVVGVIIGDSSKVYLWNELMTRKVINTAIAGQPVVLALEKDGYSFHAWKSKVADSVLTFQLDETGALTDLQTASIWNWKGECTSGFFTGKKMEAVPAYQTYYHSWERFYDTKNNQAPYHGRNNKTFSFPSATQ